MFLRHFARVWCGIYVIDGIDGIYVIGGIDGIDRNDGIYVIDGMDGIDRFDGNDVSLVHMVQMLLN